MTGVCANCTIWMDRDYTHANGDDERTNSSTPDIYKTRCPKHYYVQAQVVNGTDFFESAGEVYSSLNQVVHFVVNRYMTLGVGMYCLNSENEPNGCLDYRVRFCCGESNLIWRKSIVSLQQIHSISQRNILGLWSSHIWFDVKVLFL